jgi:hypothetical protein
MFSKIGSIFNFILTQAIVYALAFVWVRYYIDSPGLTALISLGITAALTILFRLLLTKRRRKITLSGAEKSLEARIINKLRFCSEEENLTLLHALLNKNGDAALMPECVVTTAADGKTTTSCIRIKQTKLTPDDVAELYVRVKKYAPAEIVIYTAEYTAQAAACARTIPAGNLTLLSDGKLFMLMKERNLFPELPEPQKTKAPPRLPMLLSIAFTRKKVKNYLFSAAALIFASIFIPYSLYYRIFASILLAAALISCFNIDFYKQKPPKPAD